MVVPIIIDLFDLFELTLISINNFSLLLLFFYGFSFSNDNNPVSTTLKNFCPK